VKARLRQAATTLVASWLRLYQKFFPEKAISVKGFWKIF
jgi:hypothetical protein